MSSNNKLRNEIVKYEKKKIETEKEKKEKEIKENSMFTESNKKKEKILDEDTYLKYIDEIIKKDYFQDEKSKNNINIDKFLSNYTSEDIENLKSIFYNESKDNLEEKKFYHKNYETFYSKNNFYFYPDFIRKKRNENIPENKKPGINKENTKFPKGYIEEIEKKEENKKREFYLSQFQNKTKEFSKLMKSLDLENLNSDINLNEEDLLYLKRCKIKNKDKFYINKPTKKEEIANELLSKYKNSKLRSQNSDLIKYQKGNLTPSGIKLLKNLKSNSTIFLKNHNLNSTRLITPKRMSSRNIHKKHL